MLTCVPQELRQIVVELEIEPLQEGRKREHLRAKLKLKTKVKELEKFLNRLRDLKNTLTLGLMLQRQETGPDNELPRR